MPQLAAPPQAGPARQSMAQSAGLSPGILGLLQILGSAAAPFSPSGAAAEAVTPPVQQTGTNTLAQLLTMILPAIGLIGRGKGQEIFGKDMITALQKMLRNRSIEQMPRPAGLAEDLTPPTRTIFDERPRGFEAEAASGAPLRGGAHVQPVPDITAGLYGMPGGPGSLQVGADVQFPPGSGIEAYPNRYVVAPTEIGPEYAPGYGMYVGSPSTVPGRAGYSYGNPISTHRTIGTAISAADVARLRDQYIADALAAQGNDFPMQKLSDYAPRMSGQTYTPFTSQPAKK